jgi:hypothetical protein
LPRGPAIASDLREIIDAHSPASTAACPPGGGLTLSQSPDTRRAHSPVARTRPGPPLAGPALRWAVAAVPQFLWAVSFNRDAPSAPLRPTEV